MLKPGDWVAFRNPFKDGYSTVRGIISTETTEWSDNTYLIHWEDGAIGNVYLTNGGSRHLIKV